MPPGKSVPGAGPEQRAFSVQAHLALARLPLHLHRPLARNSPHHWKAERQNQAGFQHSWEGDANTRKF